MKKIVKDDVSSKIYDLEKLSAVLDSLRQQGKKIVQCHGVFDILHPGHVYHLKQAKEKGDILVVSLTKDDYVNKGPGRPVFNEQLRAETIAALGLVDYVCLSENISAVDCIQKIKPHFYAKGGEYKNAFDDITGKIKDETEAVKSFSGEVIFTDDEVVFSSTKLANQFMNVFTEQQNAFLQNIRTKYGAEKIIKDIKELKKLKVLLVGDAIIDEYVYCEPAGQSLKNPLVVHKYLNEEKFCGGVIAVANQLAEFCNEVHLVTMLGTKNSYEDFIKSNLKQNISTRIFFKPDAPTTHKKRYVYKNVEHKTFEICYINDSPLEDKLEKEVKEYVEKIAKTFDAVLITDYGHGLLTSPIVSSVKDSKFLAVNAQTNSLNLGYNLITKKYSGINFVSLDEPESRLAAQDKHQSLESVIYSLVEKLNIDRLIVTRGQKGSIGLERGADVCVAPAFASIVVDRVGAGDIFFGVSALCSSIGMHLDAVSFLGNAASSLKLQIVCNRKSIDSTNFYKAINTLLK